MFNYEWKPKQIKIWIPKVPSTREFVNLFGQSPKLRPQQKSDELGNRKNI